LGGGVRPDQKPQECQKQKKSGQSSGHGLHSSRSEKRTVEETGGGQRLKGSGLLPSRKIKVGWWGEKRKKKKMAE